MQPHQLSPFFQILHLSVGALFIGIYTIEKNGFAQAFPLESPLPLNYQLEENQEFFESNQLDSPLFSELKKAYPKWQSYLSCPIDKETLVNYLFVGRNDSTPLKNTDIQLIQSVAETLKNTIELKQRDHLNQLLMAQISHDARSPLASLYMITEDMIMNSSLGEDPTYGSYFKGFSTRLNTTMDFLDYILTLAKVKLLNKKKIERFDCSQWATEQYVFYKDLLKEKNITWVNQIHEGTIIETHSHTFALILQALISNAIKFTEAGEIQLSYTFKENMHCLEIKDQGKGITQMDLQKIKTYSKVNSLGTQGEPGKGLDLILAQIFLNDINGKLLIKNNPDKGMMVQVRLPSQLS